jgi:hypothetical protein
LAGLASLVVCALPQQLAAFSTAGAGMVCAVVCVVIGAVDSAPPQHEAAFSMAGIG